MEGSQCRNEYSPPSSRLYTRGETSSVPPLSPHSRVHLANVLACTLVSAGCILVHDDPPKLCCSVKRRGESREGAFRREMRTVCLEWWCKKRSVMRKGRILLLSERECWIVSRQFVLFSWLIDFVWSISFFYNFAIFSLLFLSEFCERLIEEVGVSTRWKYRFHNWDFLGLFLKREINFPKIWSIKEKLLLIFAR